MKFIIYTYPYDENIGGVIVLHKLGHLLSQLGYDVLLWHPVNTYVHGFYGRLKFFERKIRYWIKQKEIVKSTVDLSPYNLPVAQSGDIDKNDIVIYPEVVSGNPLGLTNVVRWLLYIPCAHTGKIKFSDSDLFFYYLNEYDYPVMNKFRENKLYVVEYFDKIYKQKNFGDRSGSCFMVRKGKDRILNAHPVDAIQVDGKSHKELAEIFNRCEYFYSYDLYTMYSTYASLCGCKSIILPKEGLSKDEWLSTDEARYGMAYGFDDIQYALDTRDKLIERIKLAEEDNLNSVRFFIKRCQEYFSEH